MKKLRKVLLDAGHIYRGIFHVYRAWWTEILGLSLIVFLPLGLLDAADTQALESIGTGHDVKFIALLAFSLIATASSILGEVFLAGAVSLSLTHAEEGRPPSLRFMVRNIKYGRLILIDFAYVILVSVGLVFLFVPGVAVFVYFGLAGPVAEVEDRKMRSAFRRSFELIRGNFWLAFLILFPVALLDSPVESVLGHLSEMLLGESFLGVGVGEALANVVLAPIFALAAVLMTRKAAIEKDGSFPGPPPAELRSRD